MSTLLKILRFRLCSFMTGLRLCLGASQLAPGVKAQRRLAETHLRIMSMHISTPTNVKL